MSYWGMLYWGMLPRVGYTGVHSLGVRYTRLPYAGIRYPELRFIKVKLHCIYSWKDIFSRAGDVTVFLTYVFSP